MVDDDPQTLRFVRGALTRAGFKALVTGEHAELSHIIRTDSSTIPRPTAFTST